ncbi:MAG: 4Fe-4S dicluster domain-containing protein [Vicinamibacteria bacterium]|nr:4Fe-4S dicluster domain-containing protein [Vicinamibacteria bacterium]
MKAYDETDLALSFQALGADYDVRVPILLSDGTRSLGRLEEGKMALAGGKLGAKPTSVFFPQMDLVFQQKGTNVRMQAPPSKPLMVVGLTAQDADCLAFLDRFFSTNFKDDLYRQKRMNSAVVVLSGKCGRDGEMLRLSSGNCDLELVFDGDRYLALAHSQTGKAMAEKMKGGLETDEISLGRLQRESKALPDDELKLLQRASSLLLDNKVPEDFWVDISNRCIACTACNLACPTCNCFDVFDWKCGDSCVNRYRLWDSCQLDGFMREASGHNPMGTEALRTRRRIHHKLAADVIRWGQMGCFLCGRCDEVCPTGIGIKAVSREMVEKYG